MSNPYHAFDTRHADGATLLLWLAMIIAMFILIAL